MAGQPRCLSEPCREELRQGPSLYSTRPTTTSLPSAALWDSMSRRYVRYIHYSQGDWDIPFTNITIAKGWGQQYSDGEPVTCSNVVVVHAPYTARMGQDGYWMAVDDLLGEGDAEFYRDGKVWLGRWQRPGASDPFVFLAGGRASQYTTPMVFAPGRTWVEVVPSQPLVLINSLIQPGLEESLQLLQLEAPDFYRFVGSWTNAVTMEDLSKDIGGKGAGATMRPNYYMTVLNKSMDGSYSASCYLAGLLVHEAAHTSQHWQGEFGANYLSQKLTGGLFGGRTEGVIMAPFLVAAGYVAVPLEAALILGQLGNADLAEIDACNHQIECLRQMGATTGTIDAAQQYLHKNETVFAEAMGIFTNFLFSKDRLEQSRLYAERILEKHRFELDTLIPGVLETGVCEVTGSDGRKTYGILVRAVGSVSLPATLEGVPVVLRPGY